MSPSGIILIVEDDKNISRLVKYNLEKAGYSCEIKVTGEDALDYLENNLPELIILDLMLPKMDGLEVCRRIKGDDRLKRIPLLMLTARGEEVDRVVGFELGADDYVVKPFSVRELVLRVNALIRRQAPEPEQTELISAGPVIVDLIRHKVTVGRKQLELTLMEFKLLTTLIRRRGRVQSREKLLDDVWEMGADVTTRTIDTHIKRLRQKMERAGKLIETVRGIGYKFSEE